MDIWFSNNIQIAKKRIMDILKDDSAKNQNTQMKEWTNPEQTIWAPNIDLNSPVSMNKLENNERLARKV